MTQTTDFDRSLAISDYRAQSLAIAANDQFILAMAKAARSGRENVKPGTFVDPTPPVFAKRLRPDPVVSTCGSPAEMCLRAAINPVGRRSVK